MTLDTPAKVNLSLAIGAKRPDGYHDLDSVVVPLTVTDIVTVELTGAPGSVTLACDTPGVPTDFRNVAVTAADLYRQAAQLTSGITITLAKTIPVAAGLGGGSSDAAAVLVALWRLTGQPMGFDDLVRLGARVGSDVPLFLYVHVRGGPVRIRGMGEKVEPGPVLPAWSYLLANPCFPVSTAWAYQALDARLTNAGGPITVRAVAAGEVRLFNHLESVVFARFPGLVALRDALLGEGARAALLSGSGATVFGVFDDDARAASARDRLRRRDWAKVFTPCDTDDSAQPPPAEMWWRLAHLYPGAQGRS